MTIHRAMLSARLYSDNTCPIWGIARRHIVNPANIHIPLHTFHREAGDDPFEKSCSNDVAAFFREFHSVTCLLENSEKIILGNDSSAKSCETSFTFAIFTPVWWCSCQHSCLILLHCLVDNNYMVEHFFVKFDSGSNNLWWGTPRHCAVMTVSTRKGTSWLFRWWAVVSSRLEGPFLPAL